jgi:hypothetical protein
MAGTVEHAPRDLLVQSAPVASGDQQTTDLAHQAEISGDPWANAQRAVHSQSSILQPTPQGWRNTLMIGHPIAI